MKILAFTFSQPDRQTDKETLYHSVQNISCHYSCVVIYISCISNGHAGQSAISSVGLQLNYRIALQDKLLITKIQTTNVTSRIDRGKRENYHEFGITESVLSPRERALLDKPAFLQKIMKLSSAIQEFRFQGNLFSYLSSLIKLMLDTNIFLLFRYNNSQQHKHVT